MNEFELIDRFFRRDRSRDDVLIGIGDDAAVVKPDPGTAVISALATLSATSGNLPDGAAFARALTRSALNRLAAQGALPAWLTLALTLEEANSEWIGAFAASLFSAVEPFDAMLIGGDTTRGPTTATLIAHGKAPSVPRQGEARLRAGDAIFVTGELGKAAVDDDQQGLSDPRPARVNEGQRAWPYTTATGDLRESLAATFLRIIGPHDFGAEINSGQLPVSPAGTEFFKRPGGARLLVDASADPELCFVVGADDVNAFNNAMAEFECRCTRIGQVVNKTGVHLN